MIMGLWLFEKCEKQKAMQAPEEAKNVKILVGCLDDPIDIIKRSEIDDYLTEEFYMAYEVYENYRLGFGLPRGLSWDQQPMFIMNIIKLFMRESKKIKEAVKHGPNNR